jgi:hypothetical protein
MAFIVFDDFPVGLALMVAALLMMVGWTLAYVVFQIKHGRTVKEFRRELQALEARMTAAIASIRDQSAVHGALPPASQQPEQSVRPTSVDSSATHVADEISAETLLVMAAAVTVFLGKKVRVRSAQMLQTPFEIINPWSQQGRVIVQASHNLSPRGHRE